MVGKTDECKSALKKLKKKSKKVTSKSLKQLNALTANVNRNGEVAASLSSPLSPQLTKELNQLSEQVITNVVSELIQPLNPVLSWFHHGQARSKPIVALSPSNDVVSPKPAATPAARIAVNARPGQSILRVPLKSPACKRCPALAGGYCKCAAKKFNVTV
ncbi:hypothetical protein ACFOD0_10055 [Shewanella intestini]|uniref:Uncharacterized protein n=1 Tax=Shewanella intestini TaxID=2017544 RepID=A0ABS5I4Q4_9GAMM|nr:MULTISPECIES: hypothetical protein [Shewanella]MBR9728808.1 hypothetical protein [Shewanella intestini]MRG36883.1 hypothetical protein [Shewanella sp. XMDDZSB0408]